MRQKLLFSILMLLLQASWLMTFAAAIRANINKEEVSKNVIATGGLTLPGKSRQSRCVRCYEDRYYGSNAAGGYGSNAGGGYGSSAGGGYGGSAGGGYGGSAGGGYGSRSGDDRASWYYSSYDRYDDRSYKDRDYDRYSGYSDDRYAPRTYEARGYDDYRRGSYDRGYDNRNRYYAGSAGNDYYNDRYNDRYRSGSNYDRYDRDPYDRYYSRYDFRNYRPWDETYRGQSGFDNSGRGYYFASENENRQYLPYGRERQASPCGLLVPNCPFRAYGADSGERSTKVSSGAIDSGAQSGGHTSVVGKGPDSKSNSGQSNWTYMNDRDDKPDTRGDGGGVGSAGGSRSREQEQQSASYGGRPPRPLSGGYLFDRDSNVIDAEGGQQENAKNSGSAGSDAGAAASAETDSHKSSSV